MIQIPQVSLPISAIPFEPEGGAVVVPDTAPDAARDPAGTGLAGMGAMPGLHADVQRFAYATPNGPGGGTSTPGGTTNGAGAVAAPDAKREEQSHKEAQGWMDKGMTLLRQHRYSEAIEAFEQGFRLWPNPNFILNKASALFDSGRYAEALEAYELYATDPTAVRFDDAQKQIARAREKLGGREVSSVDIVEARMLAAQGEAAMKEGRYEDAFQAFDQAYEHNPIAQLKLQSAACLDKLGRPYATAERLEAYVQANPETKDAAKLGKRIEVLRAQAQGTPIPAGPAYGAEVSARGAIQSRKEAQIWNTEGIRLVREHRYTEAIEAFEIGFRTYPDPKFLINKASALFDAGRYPEALQAYELYKSDPNATRTDEVDTQIERIRDKIGDRETSAAGFVESRKLVEQGMRELQAGRFEAALAAFDKAHDLNPMPDLVYNQAVCLEKLGRNYAAIARYEHYVAARPDADDVGRVRGHLAELRFKADEAPITAGGKAGAFEWMTRGLRHTQAGRHDAAAAAFEEGFRTYPDSDFIRYGAKALLDARRFAEADLKYQTYLADPKAKHADTVRAEQMQARAAMGGREATATGVAESSKLFDKGEALYKQGRYGEALEAFDRAYHLNPLGLLRYNQAAALQKMGLRELAAQRYEAYVAETPNAPDAAKVTDWAKHLRAEAKQVAQAAFDRGTAAFSAGRYREAAGAFAEAYEQMPASQFLYNVGSSYDMAGDPAQAIKYYHLYLKMTPGAGDEAKVNKRIEMLREAAGMQLEKP